MAHDDQHLLLRLVGDDRDAEAQVIARAAHERDGAQPPNVPLLVAAAVLTQDGGFMDLAADTATQPRDRQLVALGQLQLHGDRDLFDALVRDHLATYPDQLLASWLAARPH
ncbi:hypothetical protein FHX52_1095 [Humibacillus xanthopallidus]|uniref:Uncharacterized protein n=1 Tax=Humibacillus xanthopallidus TaxID=412689 RepID=A0A543PV68_9MICO|nr:hypothetical protein [Humibacillus xanthopallidus]TQN47974.1 hypothetical protein FHX52_1095 [Humibacillus xanthopallidus]